LIFIILSDFGGWFEGQLNWQRYNDWNLFNEKNYSEIGLINKLPKGIETYTSISTTPEIYFKRMHISFSGSFYNIAIFKAEDRHWFESPVLNLVSTEKLRDESWGANAEGMRIDLWNKRYASGFLLSRYNVNEKGECFVFDLKKYSGMINFGFLFIEKNFITGVNDVFSPRFSVSKKPFDFKFEYAISNHTYYPDSLNYSYAAEMKIIPLGAFFITMKHYNFGLNFRDEVSNDFNSFNLSNFGKKGVFFDISFLVPRRAFTITEKFSFENLNRRWSYTEIYIEFINNVFFKSYFDVTKDKYGDIWKHLFFEISTESKRGKIKLQYKIKDIGVKNVEYSMGERHLFGIEGKMNITDEIGFYSRIGIGNSKKGVWETGFYQLSFRPFSNSEIYLEYGEGSHTDGDIVNDSDFADREIRTIERLRLILKYYF